VRGANFRGGPKVEVKLSKVTSKRKKEKMSFYFKHDLSSLTLIVFGENIHLSAIFHSLCYIIGILFAVLNGVKLHITFLVI
jgi:hypothetical protein